MKLTEIKTKTDHYFVDEEDRIQGEYRDWWSNGQQWEISHWRDDKYHGENKRWNVFGEIRRHSFYIDGKEIVDFIANPELYPTTPEEKTMFVLKYGSAPFIGDTNETA